MAATTHWLGAGSVVTTAIGLFLGWSKIPRQRPETGSHNWKKIELVLTDGLLSKDNIMISKIFYQVIQILQTKCLISQLKKNTFNTFNNNLHVFQESGQVPFTTWRNIRTGDWRHKMITYMKTAITWHGLSHGLHHTHVEHRSRVSVISPRAGWLGGTITVVAKRPQFDSFVFTGRQKAVLTVLYIHWTNWSTVTCGNANDHNCNIWCWLVPPGFSGWSLTLASKARSD